MDQVRERKIEFIDNVYVTKLLNSNDLNSKGSGGGRTESDDVKGALGINTEKKEIVLFVCNSLILVPVDIPSIFSQ